MTSTEQTAAPEEAVQVASTGEIESNYDEIVECFEALNLEGDLLRGIFAYGFEKPSAIQQRGIKPILDGYDTIGQAQSGTGKTATFVIAALQKIDYSLNACQVLLLAPTRELAQQIQKVALALGDYCELRCHACVGGTSVRDDMNKLKSGVHMVVDPRHLQEASAGRPGGAVLRHNAQRDSASHDAVYERPQEDSGQAGGAHSRGYSPVLRGSGEGRVEDGYADRLVRDPDHSPGDHLLQHQETSGPAYQTNEGEGFHLLFHARRHGPEGPRGDYETIQIRFVSRLDHHRLACERYRRPTGFFGH
ncbi:putative eukaryotic initiation factor-4A [Cryptosporidium felis]|nr:putative eukaryotic initiation factor-4A [Cryptosporidium felis]